MSPEPRTSRPAARPIAARRAAEEAASSWDSVSEMARTPTDPAGGRSGSLRTEAPRMDGERIRWEAATSSRTQSGTESWRGSTETNASVPDLRESTTGETLRTAVKLNTPDARARVDQADGWVTYPLELGVAAMAVS